MTSQHARQKAIDLLIGLGVAGLALALYLPTMAPGLSWAHHGADGGDLIAAVATGGVPHPSGYPTYVFLGRLAARLPVGNMAYRLNLFSALAAAASAVAVYAAGRRLWGGEGTRSARVLSAGTALAWAAGRTLWSQAVIAEVYALGALFVALALAVALGAGRPGRDRRWGILGLVLGVGLGNHLTLALALPGLAILLWPGKSPRRLALLAGGLLVGLGVYAYLPLAGAGDPPVYWGQPDRPAGFWWLVSGRLYHGYAFGLPPAEVPGRLSAWAGLWAAQWGWLGLALGLWGAALLWGRHRRVGAALAVIYAAHTFYALGYYTADSYVYLLPAHLVAVLWMGEGVAAAWALLADLKRRGPGLRRVLGAVLLVAPLAWAVVANGPRVDASRDREAQAWLEDVAQALPPGALVITGDDRHTFSLAYLQWAEGRRSDLLVVDGDLWQEPWYAAQVACRGGLGDLPTPCPLAVLVEHVLPKRPVVLTSWREELALGRAVIEEQGFWVIGGDGNARRIPGAGLSAGNEWAAWRVLRAD